MTITSVIGPHRGQPVLTAGVPLPQAQAAMILVHGRGATAASILSLAQEFDQPDFAYLAPQAAGNTWYPFSFLAPLAQNEPHLSSALSLLANLVDRLAEDGFPSDKVMLVGFSQGACLSLEFVARHARWYGGVAGLSGGLIGPDGSPRNYTGLLTGTPIFLGCSDVDFHIPRERIRHSTEVLRKLGGDVTERLYPGMGHTVNEDELDFVRGMMAGVVAN
ncbi:MAG: dienelactone hydrolase family protein [Anaerolineae bacterium]|nr:dienelactone hydrolase family protein [Anaerolineae bacterium]